MKKVILSVAVFAAITLMGQAYSDGVPSSKPSSDKVVHKSSSKNKGGVVNKVEDTSVKVYHGAKKVGGKAVDFTVSHSKKYYHDTKTWLVGDDDSEKTDKKSDKKLDVKKDASSNKSMVAKQADDHAADKMKHADTLVPKAADNHLASGHHLLKKPEVKVAKAHNDYHDVKSGYHDHVGVKAASHSKDDHVVVPNQLSKSQVKAKADAAAKAKADAAAKAKADAAAKAKADAAAKAKADAAAKAKADAAAKAKADAAAKAKADAAAKAKADAVAKAKADAAAKAKADAAAKAKADAAAKAKADAAAKAKADAAAKDKADTAAKAKADAAAKAKADAAAKAKADAAAKKAKKKTMWGHIKGWFSSSKPEKSTAARISAR
jgi:hypothetical protein